jgi:hypothetical protein
MDILSAVKATQQTSKAESHQQAGGKTLTDT